MLSGQLNVVGMLSYVTRYMKMYHKSAHSFEKLCLRTSGNFLPSQNIAHPTLIYKFNWSLNRPTIGKCTNVHRKMYTENIQFSLQAMFHLIVRSFIIQFLLGFQLNVQLTLAGLAWHNN